MKRYVVPIVLVVLAVVFGVLVFRDPSTESDGERALRKDNVFPAWRRDRIVYVSLATNEGNLRLDRDPQKNTWTLHGSPEEPDQARADVLLGELEHGMVLRKVEPSDALGLKMARVRGEIGMGELTYRFSLGRDAQKPEGAAYLEVEGAGAYVVEKRLATALLVPLTDYRDKRLLPGKDPPSTITLSPPGLPSFSLVREGRVRQRIGKDGPFASRAATQELAASLAELRAVRFLSADEGGRAVAGSPVVITVVTDAGTHTFATGGECPGAPDDVVVARTSAPPVYACVAKGVVATATRGRDVYVDKMAFYARVDEVEEISLVRPGEAKLDLARKGSGFRLRAPEGRDLDGDASDGVRAWLGALLALEGEPLEGAIEGVEVARVNLVYGTIKEDVRFVRTADKRLVASRADGRGVVLSAVAARIVSPPAALLRGPRLVPSRIARGMRLVCAGLTQEIVRKDGLRFVGAEPFPLDASLAAQALSTLLDARAEAWVSDTRADFFPSNPPCRATVLFADDAGASELTLELSAPTEGSVYGAIVGRDEVFLASPSLVATMVRPLASREGFVVDVERAYEVTVFDGLGVTKIGLDDDAGAGAKDALASLRPSFVVRRGGLSPQEVDVSAPKVVVGLRVDGGPAKEASFRFGKEVSAPEGKVVYAVRDGLPFVFAVSTEPVKQLLALVRKRP